MAALVAAAALLINLSSGKRQQDALDTVARAAADSAAIARESAEYFKRMAESMEKSLEDRDAAIAASARGDATSGLDDLVSFRRAAWEIKPLRGSLYELVNSGGGTAYNVRVTCDGAIRFDGPETPSEWTAGSGREFFAVGSMQTGIPVLHVEWTDTPVEAAQVQEWTRPIPPRS